MNIDKLKTITICPVSALFPDEWTDWIFDALASEAPFSWGDNTHTLVEAKEFKEHLDYVFFKQDHIEDELTADINKHKDSIFNILKKLEDLEVLLDLEN
jgi:hypothetical protein